MQHSQFVRLVAALLVVPGGGLRPLTPVRTRSGLRQCVATAGEGQYSAWFEGDYFRSSGSGRRRTLLKSEVEPPPPDSSSSSRAASPLAFYSPDTGNDWKNDDDDLFLPPKAPEPIREGELGGEIGSDSDAVGGRTEGYYAALSESPDQLRGSDLNEVLQPDYLDRLKFTNFPLQAYGAVFKWEVLVCDAVSAYRKPWQVVADEHGLPMPDDDYIMRAVGTRPERAIMQMFNWSDDWGETQKLAFEHYEAKAATFREAAFTPAEGVLDWLRLLKQYEVPCCLCAGTSLDRACAEAVVKSAGLDEFIDAYVTAEDGCEQEIESYLVSCIKVRRPPEKIVVFENDARGIVAAHEALTKAIAIVDGHANGSDLRHADLRVGGMDALSLMSLRELFKDVTAR